MINNCFIGEPIGSDEIVIPFDKIVSFYKEGDSLFVETTRDSYMFEDALKDEEDPNRCEIYYELKSAFLNWSNMREK